MIWIVSLYLRFTSLHLLSVLSTFCIDAFKTCSHFLVMHSFIINHLLLSQLMKKKNQSNLCSDGLHCETRVFHICFERDLMQVILMVSMKSIIVEVTGRNVILDMWCFSAWKRSFECVRGRQRLKAKRRDKQKHAIEHCIIFGVSKSLT